MCRHQEPLQALKYEEGGKYDAHWDYFDPALYAAQPSMLRMLDGDGSRNRIVRRAITFPQRGLGRVPSKPQGERGFVRTGDAAVVHE